ncbi:MAG: adenine-specific methyltransferase EcoRI family protein [Actinomyces sp.]|nr:adenine-specific methyltransferase EcoRI family protein [Actinomyces sp.]
MAGNRSLDRAKAAKKDEFYTQLSDIEKEMRHYRRHFKGKTILCNCDDPFESNFFKFFVLNFQRLGLKKLIATCYAGSPITGSRLSLFDVLGGDDSNRGKPYKAVVTKVYDATGDGGVDMLDVAELFKSGENELMELEGDGDFRSPECLELLQEADIVVTNPPFSLFREYIATLMEYQKYFIVIGNQNAITYKEIFPLLMENKMWLGNHFGDMVFTVPDSYEPRATRYWQDENGQKWRSMGNVCWFTNLDIKKRHEMLILVKRYSGHEDEYPRYDNYDAINVDRVKDIPEDWMGVMGVPITFLDKYNPDQFELVAFRKGDDGQDLAYTRERESLPVFQDSH